VSSEKTINASDTLLKSVSIGGINANASITINSDVQSALVDQGYFLGVCLATVVNEANVNNNCSEGIALKSGFALISIILMLLDE
jgi:hypothetical protein